MCRSVNRVAKKHMGFRGIKWVKFMLRACLMSHQVPVATAIDGSLPADNAVSSSQQM